MFIKSMINKIEIQKHFYKLVVFPNLPSMNRVLVQILKDPPNFPLDQSPYIQVNNLINAILPVQL